MLPRALLGTLETPIHASSAPSVCQVLTLASCQWSERNIVGGVSLTVQPQKQARNNFGGRSEQLRPEIWDPELKSCTSCSGMNV